jgi:PAS domain S-box-containing protein
MLQDSRSGPAPGPAGIDATLLRAVAETAISGVILIDARNCVLMFNPACKGLFEYSADDVIGQNVKMLMPSPYREAHDNYLDNFHQTGLRKIIGIGREMFGRRKRGSRTQQRHLHFDGVWDAAPERHRRRGNRRHPSSVQSNVF